MDYHRELFSIYGETEVMFSTYNWSQLQQWIFCLFLSPSVCLPLPPQWTSWSLKLAAKYTRSKLVPSALGKPKIPTSLLISMYVCQSACSKLGSRQRYSEELIGMLNGNLEYKTLVQGKRGTWDAWLQELALCCSCCFSPASEGEGWESERPE